MYPNLNAEMSRIGIEQKDIAQCIQKGADAVSLKMNGKRAFLLDEAKTIKKTFFNDLTLDYLFETRMPKEKEE